MNGEEWKVARNLHEIIVLIPSFIDKIKNMEGQAKEMNEVI